jgi:hypothetical protein
MRRDVGEAYMSDPDMDEAEKLGMYEEREAVVSFMETMIERVDDRDRPDADKLPDEVAKVFSMLLTGMLVVVANGEHRGTGPEEMKH